MVAVRQTATGSGATTPVSLAWGSATTAGSPLVAVVNSATVVTPPAGWTLRHSFVDDQGFYVYEKTAAAGEAAFSVATNGNWPTSITLIEFNAAEISTFDVVSTGSRVTGNHLTRTIASATATAADYVLAIVALHGTATASSFGSIGWNNSFTTLVTSAYNSPITDASSASVQHFIGSKALAAAGAIGATTATWGQNAENSYAIHLAYKAIATGGSVALAGTISDLALTAPVGTVSATAASTNVNLTGTVSGLTAVAPTGSVTLETNVAGVADVADLAVTAPAGTVVASGSVALTGVVSDLAVVAPTGTVAAGSVTLDATLAGTVSDLTLTAPVGTVTAGSTAADVTLTGTPSDLTLTAPAGNATTSTVGDVSLVGTTPHLQLSAPVGAVGASSSSDVSLTGPPVEVTVLAPAGTVGVGSDILIVGEVSAVAIAAFAGNVATTALLDLVGATVSVTLAAPAGSYSDTTHYRDLRFTVELLPSRFTTALEAQ